MGPHQIDEFVRQIRVNYDGPLQIARDLMRIDL
jgi:ribonuclease Z